MEKRRKKRKKKRSSLKIGFAFIGFFLGFLVLFVFNVPFRDQIFRHVMGIDNPESTVILVVGQDGINPVRSDTIILLCLNTDSGEVLFYSIPRDTRLMLPDRYYDKANHAYSRGGAEMLRETLENAFRMHIHYYVETDFEGFADIVDTLGGIEIEVEQDMYYVDRAQDLRIDLRKGKQMLSGDQALQYVRYRSDGLGDLGRISRQQKFIDALLREIESPAHLPQIPQIINELRDAVGTDIPTEKLISLALWFKGLSEGTIKLEMLPGDATYIEGVSYYEPDLEAGRQELQEFFARKKSGNDG